MPVAPLIVSALDDVSPKTGEANYGDYTNDTAPVLHIVLGDQLAPGDTLAITDDRTSLDAQVTLTGDQLAQGFVDVPVSGLVEGWNLLTVSGRRTDGATVAGARSFALGIATATPESPTITRADDDAGAKTGSLADGAHTDDTTPSFHIYEAGLPPTPSVSPGHAPYGGPALFGGRIQLYEGGHLVGDANLGYDGVVTITPGALSLGEHTLTAVAIDRAGNVSAPSAPFHVVIDSTDAGTPQAGETSATSGDDLLQAGPGYLLVHGGDGNDTLLGSDSNEALYGDAGADSIVGGSGFNIINGNQGDDSIVGHSKIGDWLLGGQGDDRIDASQSSGHNIVNGNLGSDTIIGGSAAEVLRGGQGDDVIVGGGGADWISGDLGSNTLTGGAGADVFFHAVAGGGIDRVLDFNAAQGDHILLDSRSYTAGQVGADTVIDFGGHGQMVLVGVDYAALQPGWIIAV